MRKQEQILDFEALPECTDTEANITRQEFESAVRCMKKDKATGVDGVPAGVWANSDLAKEVIFEFLQKIWAKEQVPEDLAVCVFIMIYKNKGSPDDYSKYRAIGLLNHSYMIMSTILLRRLITECSAFISEWQAGFRAHRDNLLLLRLLYDSVINDNSSCVITYIDYTSGI